MSKYRICLNHFSVSENWLYLKKAFIQNVKSNIYVYKLQAYTSYINTDPNKHPSSDPN
jgi:hypothetical protein